MTAIPRNDADAIVARLDHTAFLAAASLDDRIDLVNRAAGRRLESAQAAAVWLQWLSNLPQQGDVETLRRLVKEVILLAPYAEVSESLFDTLTAGVEDLAPAGTPVFMITSCRKYLDKARQLRASLAERGALAWIISGDQTLAHVRWNDEGCVLPVPDTYEALPSKVLRGVEAMVERYGPCTVVKIDDDCQPDAAFDIEIFKSLCLKHDYIGVGGMTAHHDRLWHHGKTSRRIGVYGRRHHGSWATGGCYVLSARATRLIAKEAMFFPGEFSGEHYEDKAIGDFLRRRGITLHQLAAYGVMGVAVSHQERLVEAIAATPVLTVPVPAESGPADHRQVSAEAMLSALPRPIAVVGNGRCAREFGARIDRYASVIRLNNYVLEGFETLVGRKTDLRVTSGRHDSEPRSDVPELSPFHAQRPESTALPGYRQRGGQALATPDIDIGPLLPALPKPSTGIALLALCSHLGIEVDAYGFDGFRSGHYWDGRADRDVHRENELDVLLSLPGVTLMGASYDYAGVYDVCHTEHAGYDSNEGLRLVRALGIELRGEAILEFGAGNGGLAHHLQASGNRVIAMEASEVALRRIPVVDKVRGDCLDLARLNVETGTSFDRFVAIDVLEHLTENDARIAIREAARLCRGLLVTVSTRPSGLLGPHGENLHLTVRPVGWWVELIQRYFVVSGVVPGIEVGQVVLEGQSRQFGAVEQAPNAIELELPPRLPALGLPDDYRCRDVPEYFVDSVDSCSGVEWQPDVYPAAARLARSFGCDVLVDIGCGQARKLVAQAPEFQIVGVDYGANIEHCRRTHRVGTWLEADLERALPLPLPAALLTRSVVVCSDVIEHLIDPMPLLAILKRLLRDCAAVVLSTPDRARTNGSEHRGPSHNTSHTREWNADELQRLLTHAGFDVALVSHTRSNDARPDLATILAVLVNVAHPAITASRRADAGTDGAAVAQVEPPAGNAADEWLARAQACQAANDARGFESAMGQVFELNIRHSKARRYLAGLQLHGGDPGEAAWIYESLIDGGEVDAETVEGAVLAHWRSGDSARAVARLLLHR
jgi:2-polyprenyl-3-methyl-5-hydroxy-6-metoxy-1,4-benzoquinol methylase